MEGTQRKRFSCARHRWTSRTSGSRGDTSVIICEYWVFELLGSAVFVKRGTDVEDVEDGRSIGKEGRLGEVSPGTDPVEGTVNNRSPPGGGRAKNAPSAEAPDEVCGVASAKIEVAISIEVPLRHERIRERVHISVP